MAMVIMDKAGVKYEKVYVEENEDFFRENGIKEAPTLLVIDGENLLKIANPSNIKKYIEELK